MIKEKKGQFFYGGLIDASTLPKWILYPLLILVCLILLVTVVLMILFVVSWFKGDATFMPFGMFGYGWGFPIIYGGGISITQQHCSVNGVPINCSDFPTQDYKHFCVDGNCEINSVCGGDYKSNLDCIGNITK